MESQACSLDLDDPVQYLQFSHENKEVMWLSQGHRESLSEERRRFLYLLVFPFIHSRGFIHCLLWVQGITDHTRPHCIPNSTSFPVLHAFFSKDQRHSGGNFTQTWTRATEVFLPLHPPQLSPRFSSPRNCLGHQEIMDPIGVSGIYFIWIDLNWMK